MRACKSGREGDVEAKGEREEGVNNPPNVGVYIRLRVLRRAVLGRWRPTAKHGSKSRRKPTFPADAAVGRRLSWGMCPVQGAHDLLEHGEHGVLFHFSVGAGGTERVGAWRRIAAEELLEFGWDVRLLERGIVVWRARGGEGVA